MNDYRELLRRALPFLEEHCDQGPSGEGWQSDDLKALIKAAEILLASDTSHGWFPATDPPAGEPQKWTKPVVAVTNAGEAYALTYMHGADGRPGVWQRPARFAGGEVVLWWRPLPK